MNFSVGDKKTISESLSRPSDNNKISATSTRKQKKAHSERMSAWWETHTVSTVSRPE